MSDIADVLTSQGDLTGAIATYNEALAATTNVRDRSGQITALARKADVMVWQGDLQGAKKLYHDTVNTARNINRKAEEVDALDSYAQLLILEGDLTAAAETCQEIRALNVAIGKKGTQTGSWRSSFDLLFETGRAPQAETLAHDAVQESVKEQSSVVQAIAENLVARSLLAQGKSGEAKDVVALAVVHGLASNDVRVRLTSAITSASIRAVQGDLCNAEKELAGVLDDAKRIGFFDLRLEAMMALADVQLRRGEQDPARILLSALEADAAAHGFNLIATKAANARKTRLVPPSTASRRR